MPHPWQPGPASPATGRSPTAPSPAAHSPEPFASARPARVSNWAAVQLAWPARHPAGPADPPAAEAATAAARSVRPRSSSPVHGNRAPEPAFQAEIGRKRPGGLAVITVGGGDQAV